MSLSQEILWKNHADKITNAFIMEGMSTRYGWTPDYIKKLREDDNDTYMIYCSILGGESDSKQAKQEFNVKKDKKKNGNTSSD